MNEASSPSETEQELRRRVAMLEARLADTERRLHQATTGNAVVLEAALMRIDTGVLAGVPMPATSALLPETARPPLPSSEARGDELGSQAPTAAPDVTELPPFELKAFRLLRHGWGEGWEIRPAPSRRPWMDNHTHAYHCLPLVVANQWGWQLICPTDARVVWDGGGDPGSLWVEVDPQFQNTVKSQFGQGIVTFSPPWLFQTPPGWDLMVNGPMNQWKVNCAPLEGIIETWWLPYTFTMNWKLVEPGEVIFKKGESLCQLIPIPHATFRHARASEPPIESDIELAKALSAWRDERRRRAGSKQQNHLMYRKAENVEGHLVRVPVPPVEPT